MQRAENITNKKISITNNDKIIYSKETNIDYTKDWTEQKKVVEDSSLIPIIDNIENSDRCTNSKDIRKEISQKSKGENKIKFTYKLPLGRSSTIFSRSGSKEEISGKRLQGDIWSYKCSPQSFKNNNKHRNSWLHQKRSAKCRCWNP